MQEINGIVADKYNLGIKSIIPFKDTYIVNSDKGRKILKKTDLSPDRILFVHGAKEHLYKNGFKGIDRYCCTVEGDPFINISEEFYTLMNAIEGRECNFDNRGDIIKATAILASMHKASKGFVPPEGSKTRDELGKIPSYFIKRLDEIKKQRKIAKKGKSKFDYLFLEYADYFYNLGENAIKSLECSKYNELVEMTRAEGTVCHHDYTHNNIICGENGLSIINFEFCCFELKVYDIANLLRRKMRKCDWDINEAKIIIDEYKKIENISYDEFFVMKIIMQFPQKFWRVVNKYYNSRRSWSEKSYVSKLQEVIDEIEYHKKFMERYDDIIKG